MFPKEPGRQIGLILAGFILLFSIFAGLVLIWQPFGLLRSSIVVGGIAAALMAVVISAIKRLRHRVTEEQEIARIDRAMGEFSRESNEIARWVP
jgi:hypothetical protein